jgi:two-component system CheB/CheR fusion protein
MDGLQLARRLRSEPDLDSTILVAISGYGTVEDRQASAAAGCEHHLLKPVDPADLRWLLADYGTRLQKGQLLRE